MAALRKKIAVLRGEAVILSEFAELGQAQGEILVLVELEKKFKKEEREEKKISQSITFWEIKDKLEEKFQRKDILYPEYYTFCPWRGKIYRKMEEFYINQGVELKKRGDFFKDERISPQIKEAVKRDHLLDGKWDEVMVKPFS